MVKKKAGGDEKLVSVFTTFLLITVAYYSQTR